MWWHHWGDIWRGDVQLESFATELNWNSFWTVLPGYGNAIAMYMAEGFLLLNASFFRTYIPGEGTEAKIW